MASAIYKLRDATWDDIELLFGITFAVNQRKDKDREIEYLNFVVGYEPEMIQVIQYEGKDIGQLRAYESRNRVYIGRIQIRPEYQGLGIGSTVISDFIAQGRRAGLPTELEVHVHNSCALRLYQRLGFSIVGWGKYSNGRSTGYFWKMRCS